ncbi:hypothetical protein KIPB_006399, partial [Kipferlia bialata]
GLSTLGSLTVTGASSLSTLTVSSTSTLDSVDVTGAATVGTTLNVTGAATAASITATTGAFDTVSVTSGGSTVYSLPTTAGTTGQVLTYGASGPAWVSAGAASTDLTGTSLTISGASSLTTLGVSGASTLAGASFSDNVSIATGKTLTVDTVQATPTKDLALTAPTVKVSGDLSITSGTVTASALSVTGVSTLASATLSSTLDVTGLSTLGSLTVTGASSLSTLTVTGASTLDSVGVTGAATADSVTATTGAFDTVSVTSGSSTVYSLPSTIGTEGQVLGVSSSSLDWVTPSSGGASADLSAYFNRDFTITAPHDTHGAYTVSPGQMMRLYDDGTIHSISESYQVNGEWVDGGYIGIANEAGTSGDSIGVSMIGGFYDAYTGLSPGQKYWASYDDGQPIVIADPVNNPDLNYVMGYALSTTTFSMSKLSLA